MGAGLVCCWQMVQEHSQHRPSTDASCPTALGKSKAALDGLWDRSWERWDAKRPATRPTTTPGSYLLGRPEAGSTRPSCARPLLQWIGRNGRTAEET